MLIVTTSSLTGILLSYRLRERVETLRQLSAMLDEIILHIRWGASTVQEIIDNLCMNSAYSHLGFLPLLNSSKADFITRWNNAVDSWSDKRSITDIELLRSLANGLGESDTEGQLSWYMQKKAYVDAALSEAAEEYGKKARLYRTLGVLCGVFIAVVMV